MEEQGYHREVASMCQVKNHASYGHCLCGEEEVSTDITPHRRSPPGH